MELFGAPILSGLAPLLRRRIVVIDAGTRCLKVLVVESSFGAVRLLHRQAIDLQEEGLLAPDEVHQHLETVLPELGPHEVAVVLPQHRSIVQLLELPEGSATESRKFVEAEAAKLSGLAESAMLLDCARLRPFGKYQNPGWLTLCRASEVWEHINRCAPVAGGAAAPVEETRVREIATTAQGLFAASLALRPRPRTAVLVDLGASNTVVGILLEGQGVFAASLPGGSQQFTEAIARARGCSLEEAEDLKRSADLLGGESGVAALAEAVGRWHAELKRAVAEWLEDNPELELSLAALPVYVCGGGASQPGLLDYVNGLSSLQFRPWPAAADSDGDWPMSQYWVAYGVALQALGRWAQPVSLLPPNLHQVRRRTRLWQYVQTVNVALVVAVILTLGIVTWQKARLGNRKARLVAETEAALQGTRAIQLLSQRLATEYEQVRPILERQQQTAETLQSLAAIRQARSNRSFWYVLFADPTSYFAGTTLPVAATNLTNVAVSLFPTNASPPRREFVAEMCIPQEGEEMRRTLSQVVGELGRNPLFARVDVLPAERRRTNVDAKVLLTNRHFGLAMELRGSGTPSPSRPVDKMPLAPAAREPRRGAPPPKAKADRAVAPSLSTNR